MTPPCEFHRSCGGCQIQALSYEKQLEFKQRKIRNNLKRIGGFSEEMLEQVMEPIIGMDEPYHYRNKAQFPVGRDREGRTVTGFYAGRTHTIIPNRNCLLGMPMNEKKILETVLSFLWKNTRSSRMMKKNEPGRSAPCVDTLRSHDKGMDGLSCDQPDEAAACGRFGGRACKVGGHDQHLH